MLTVFDTPPPHFSNKEVKDILFFHYKIKANSKLLFSDRDQNFLINDSLGKKYILKISNPAESLDYLKLQNHATLLIQSNDSDLRVPKLIDDIKSIKKDGIIFFVRLIKFIEGEFLKNIILNEGSYFKLGEFLGRLDISLTKVNQKFKKTNFDWDVRTINSIKSRLSFIKNENDKDTIIYFLNAYKSNVEINDLKLRKMFIHNDANDQNILEDRKGNLNGIIDFGDMVYSYQVAEPAVCMAYVALGKSEPYGPMVNVLKGYHSKFPLKNIELESAIYISCIRLCISVTMAAWRTKLFPSNKYLLVSQHQAWNFLRKMRDEDLEIFSKKMVDYAQS
jgi:ethanolamine-phosphate phospho-lyase